jgi:hypothetical protein
MFHVTNLTPPVGTFHHVILQSKHGSIDEASAVHVTNLIPPGSECQPCLGMPGTRRACDGGVARV